MAHKRSPEALQRRLERKEAKILVMKNAFMDREKSEMVNLLSGKQINGLLLETFGSLQTVDSGYEKGEVLTNSRGSGSLQRVRVDRRFE
jgi:hypothetical protein